MKLSEVVVEGVTLEGRQPPKWMADIIRWLPLWVAATVDVNLKFLYVHHSIAGMFFVQLYADDLIFVQYEVSAGKNETSSFATPTAAANFILRQCRNRALQEARRVLQTVKWELPEGLAKQLEKKA